MLSFGGLGLFMLGRFAGSWIMGRVRAEKMLLVKYGDGVSDVRASVVSYALQI